MAYFSWQQIKPPTVQVWRTLGEEEDYVGNMNEYEFMTLLVTIKQNQYPNFWAYHAGIRYPITVDGRCKLHEPFNIMSDCLKVLVGF